MKINGYKINIANTFYKRLIGLSFKKNIKYGMLFKKCSSIHTFFMRFNIDIILIKDDIVIDIKTNVKPNKIIIFKQRKTSIIEIPNGTSLDIKIGQKITLHQ